MDINQWIHDSYQADPPNESRAFVNQSCAQDDCSAPKHRQHPGRSSLLEPLVDFVPHAHEHSLTSAGQSNSETTSVISASSIPYSSLSSHREAYKKKSRRPAKADKYLPKSKHKLQTHKKRKKKDKQKQSKGRPREQRKSEKTTGVIQSFQARNVPSHRLTLDPGNRVGFYTKGRSSAPVRGKGLPDLTFSEMRFLQKPEILMDEEQIQKTKKKTKRQRTPRELSDKEMSRYFDVGRSSHKEKKQVRKEHERSPTPSHPPERTPSIRTTSAAMKITEKPFLGSGIEGTHPPATSYYSWSNSGKETRSPVHFFCSETEPLAVGQLQSFRIRAASNRDFPRHESPAASTARPEIKNDHAGTNDHMRDAVTDASNPRLPSDDIADHTTIAQPQGTKGHERPISSSLIEELLQGCRVAARTLTPIGYDDMLPQQTWYASHEHANLQLWREDGGHYFEHDYQSDMAPMNIEEHVNLADPTEYFGGNAQWLELGDTEGYASDFLDSQLDDDCLAFQHEERNQDIPMRQDDVRQYQIEDDEDMDELAAFWQPNRLY